MWRKAREQTSGRVQAIGHHPEVGLHQRAADIYLDPFPVTSPTAFLEAGSYGLPIVSFCPHRDRSAVLCADDFTLDDQLVRTDSAKSFATEVGRLIEDGAARVALAGRRPKGSLPVTDPRRLPTGWQRCMRASQQRMQPVVSPPATSEEPDRSIAVWRECRKQRGYRSRCREVTARHVLTSLFTARVDASESTPRHVHRTSPVCFFTTAPAVLGVARRG